MPRLPIRGIACLAAVVSTLRLFAASDPLELPAAQDVTVYVGATAEQWAGEGARPTIDVMAAAKDKHRVLMSFDFSGDASRPCTAATLRLHAEEFWPNKSRQALRVHRLLRPFSEGYATWGRSATGDTWVNSGGDFDPVAFCARRVAKDDEGKDKTIDIDVTGLVQGWQAKKIPNCGLILAMEGEGDSYVRFVSKDGAVDARPRLLLYYATPQPKNPDMIPASQLKPLGEAPKVGTQITTKRFETATVGKEYKAKLDCTGGVAPYAWKAAGLPDGMSLSADGVLSGTPAKAGTTPITFIVTGADQKSASSKIVFNVNDPSQVAAVPDAADSVKGLPQGGKPAAKTPPEPAKKTKQEEE